MKILVVSQHYFPETFSLTDICEEFVRQGHVVTVVTGQPCYGEDHIYEGYEKPGEEVHNGVRIIRLKTKPRKKSGWSLIQNYLSFWHSSKKFIRRFKEQYDVVYSMVLSPITAASAANLYAKKHHVRHVHHCLDLWPESVVAVGASPRKGLKYRFFYKLSRGIYRKMDAIIVSSPSFIEYFHDVLKLPDIPITYIPQPAVIQEDRSFEPVVYEKGFNVVYAGNIGHVQMVDTLVEACAPFKNDKDFCFHILGSGSELDNVLAKIKALDLEHIVKYEGRVPASQIWRYYENADLLIGALKNDGSYVSKTIPNKFVTYMAYGKPIVFACEGDANEIGRRIEGVFLARLDGSSISSTIGFVRATAPEQLKLAGTKCRQFYLKNYQPKKIFCDILSVLSRDLCQ